MFYILLSGKKKTFVELLLQLGTTESKQPLSESAHKQELNDHSSEIHPKRRRAQTSPPSSGSSFHMPRAMAELLGMDQPPDGQHSAQQRLQVLLSIHLETFQIL